jgi:hypothetical protein
MLTDEQIAVLAWMVETGPYPHLHLHTLGEGPTLVGSGPGSANLDVSDSDISELAALGLIRPTGRNAYVVTNAGREVVGVAQNPPPERPRVGFSPTA